MAIDAENYAFSFSHAIITANGTQYTGIDSVAASQSIDRGVVRGTSRKPQKRAAGELAIGEGTINFSDLKEFHEFYGGLGDDPSKATFAVFVVLENEAGDTVSYEYIGCALNGLNMSFEAGADALSSEVPFSFLAVKVDGREFARD